MYLNSASSSSKTVSKSDCITEKGEVFAKTRMWDLSNTPGWGGKSG